MPRLRTSYATCLRVNIDRLFPDFAAGDCLGISGTSDQRIFILRPHRLRRDRLTVAVANDIDYPMDLAGLNRVIVTLT